MINPIRFNQAIIEQKKQELDFLHHFSMKDYDLIDLPMIETFKWTNLSKDDLNLMENRHKWQHEGEILALRSDWTHAIVRYREKYHLHSEKIAYAGQVYTLNGEKHQLGLEIFTDDTEKQLHVLKEMIHYIQNELQVNLSVAVISHNSLLSQLLTEEEWHDPYTRKFINERNRDALRAKLGADHPIVEFMGQQATKQTAYVKQHFPHLKSYIEEMEKWEAALNQEQITYVYGDMLKLPSQSYYKGIFVQLYTENAIEPIASGGQYSSPTDAFGMGLNI
uniref:ATP phosphoribosyltransferase regulatory subunit n=1 Tax=Aerococcus urinaeequi TaxID=51665 RepID=UPI00352A7DB1